MKPRVSNTVFPPPGRAVDPDAGEVVTLHSLFWLAVGSAVGILLAILLLAPGWGRMLAPFSYGRLVTVHLDINLYGWCSLPLIGLLFCLYLPRTRPSHWGVAAVGIWSGCLLFAVIGWLTGRTSGKLFMEWAGASRIGVAFAMAFLALALGISYRQRLAEENLVADGPAEGRWVQRGKWVLLALLAAIPPVMYWAASPTHAPPINPDSGGATGGSLLGSSLGIVMIFWALPFLLNLARRCRLASHFPMALLLLVHTLAFAALDHGDHSHHEPLQRVALCSLAIWLPLLIWHYRRFDWPARSTAWLTAFCAWGVILLATALFTVMPGVLERWKFTNALVSHSHIAMAGMLTNFNILVLLAINRGTSLSRVFDARGPFHLWQFGLALHASTLLLAGTLESRHPDWLFTGHAALMSCYAGRLLGGAMMAVAAGYWCWRAHAIRHADAEQRGATP